MASCDGRNSYPGWRFSSNPPGPKIPSTVISSALAVAAFFDIRFLCASVPLWPILLLPRRLRQTLRPVRKMLERGRVRVIHLERRDGNGPVANGSVIGVGLDSFGELLLAQPEIPPPARI